MIDEKSGSNTAKEYLITLMIDNIKNYNIAMSSNNYEASYYILKQCINNYYPYLSLKTYKENKETKTYIEWIDKAMLEAEKNIFDTSKGYKDETNKLFFSEKLKEGVKCLNVTHRLLMDCMNIWGSLLPVIKHNTGGDLLGSDK